MKYFLVVIFCICSMASQAKVGDTVFVENKYEVRYLRYLDSLQAYRIAYSVAKNMADSIRAFTGSNALDGYFMNHFDRNYEGNAEGFIYDLKRGAHVDIGHVSDEFHGMKNDTKFPWGYLDNQYKRLDSIKIQPDAIMEGGELPNVYLYLKPITTVVYRAVKRFTVVGQIIKFSYSNDGKTKTPYIEKFYYAEFEKGHVVVDSVEKLDPIYHKHMNF